MDNKNLEKQKKEYLSKDFRVRYNEVDRMGIVNNNIYNIYFEEARISLLLEMGYDYTNQEDLLFSVTKSHIEFLKPLYFGDRFTIRAAVERFKNVSLKVKYEIYKDESLMSKGYTVHACINTQYKLIDIPADFINRYKSIFLYNM